MSVKNPVEFNELYHHGILGMKWGKRNGPPYPLDAEGKAAVQEQRRKSKTQKRLEEVAKMSDGDLDKAVQRLKKEKEYLDLTGKDITRGQNFVENLAIAAASVAATTLVTTSAKKSGEALVATVMHKILNPQVFGAIYKKK